MRWRVTIPGQPVSLDRAYVTGKMPVTRRGRPVLDETGTPRLIHRPILTKAARQWRDDVQLLCQTARPGRWRPDGQIRVVLDLFLTRDVDVDNTGKLVLDGLARAIEYDDRHFLVCYRSKQSGVALADARVEITVDDDTSHPI